MDVHAAQGGALDGNVHAQDELRGVGVQGGQLRPHGLVGWLGTGSVAPRARDFMGWLPNFGVGYRYEVQPRMNLRLDVGFAEEQEGWQPSIYFNFNEAF